MGQFLDVLRKAWLTGISIAVLLLLLGFTCQVCALCFVIIILRLNRIRISDSWRFFSESNILTIVGQVGIDPA